MANSLDKFRKGVAQWSGNIGSAGISDAVVKTVPLASTSGLPTDTAVMITVNRVDTNGKKTGNYEGIVGVVSGSNLIDCIRGVEGTAQAWTGGTVVEVLHTASNINELIDGILAEHNQDGTHKDTLVTSLKATGAEITTGTEDAKIVTPKAIADSTIAKAPATATENAAGTDNAKFITALANVPAFNSSLSRQAIINGNFDVWQRGTSVALTDATFTFLADHWKEYHTKDGGTLPTLTRSRQILTSGDIPNAFYYTRLTTNGAGSSLGVNSNGRLHQNIEFGTRNLCGDGKKVTVSFWARSDISNKRLCVSLRQYYGSGGSPSATEKLLGTPITLTSTWTKYTATFTTNTLASKTFGTDNNDYLDVYFYYMWGATYGDSYVQTGVSAETYVGSGNIDIAQVQLCAGDVALPFMPKSFEEELRACQRYAIAINPTSDNGVAASSGVAQSETSAAVFVNHPVEMRTIPALESTTASDWAVSDFTSYDIACTNLVVTTGTSTKVAYLVATVAGGLALYRPTFLISTGTNKKMILTSEL